MPVHANEHRVTTGPRTPEHRQTAADPPEPKWRCVDCGQGKDHPSEFTLACRP